MQVRLYSVARKINKNPSSTCINCSAAVGSSDATAELGFFLRRIIDAAYSLHAAYSLLPTPTDLHDTVV